MSTPGILSGETMTSGQGIEGMARRTLKRVEGRLEALDPDMTTFCEA